MAPLDARRVASEETHEPVKKNVRHGIHRARDMIKLLG